MNARGEAGSNKQDQEPLSLGDRGVGWMGGWVEQDSRSESRSEQAPRARAGEEPAEESKVCRIESWWEWGERCVEVSKGTTISGGRETNPCIAPSWRHARRDATALVSVVVRRQVDGGI